MTNDRAIEVGLRPIEHDIMQLKCSMLWRFILYKLILNESDRQEDENENESELTSLCWLNVSELSNI
jgi:hypothetical protein